jgi:hypothetical protein
VATSVAYAAAAAVRGASQSWIVSRLLPATAPVAAARLVNAGTLPASARSTGGAAARAAPAPARAAVTALSATTAAIVLLMTTFLPLSTEGNICHEQEAQK